MRVNTNLIWMIGACVMLMVANRNPLWGQEADGGVVEIVVEVNDENVTVTQPPQAIEVEGVQILVESQTAETVEPARVRLNVAGQPRVLFFADRPQSQPIYMLRRFTVSPDFTGYVAAPPGGQFWSLQPRAVGTFVRQLPVQGGVVQVDQLPYQINEFNGVLTLRTTATEEPAESWQPGEFMIGVSLSGIDSELIRQHLGIDAEVGLVVDEVFEGSPAQSAGLEVGDILLRAGETDLKGAQDLVDALQNFDSDAGNTIALEVIQKGERHTIEVTPTTRQELLGYDLELEASAIEDVVTWQALVNPNYQLTPHGIVAPQMGWGPQQPDGLTQSIQSLTEQVERLQEAINRLEQRLDEE